MFWGFPLKGKKSVNFNARAETVARYKMFRDSKPVVIPTSGFYEWRGEAHGKQKYRFRIKDAPVTFIAGIRQDFADLHDGVYPERFTMLTARPAEGFGEYHHREPLVLKKEACGDWPEGALSAAKTLIPPPLAAVPVFE